MNKILAIIWKDALTRFASRSELLFFIVLPLVFTFILGGGFNPNDANNRVRLLVVDEAQTALSAQLRHALQESDTVRAELLPRAEAEKIFDEREAAALLIIPAGFAADQLALRNVELELRQQPNNLNAQAAERAILAAAGTVGRALFVANASVAEAERWQPFADQAERDAYFAAALTQAQTLFDAAPDRVMVQRAALPDQVTYDPAANASAGQMITWVFIPLLGISGLFAYERAQGTLRRLLTTPTRKATFLLGTIGGQVVAALAQMALLITFGVLVMGLNWGQAPAALVLMLVTFALAAAALGAMLGTFVKSEGQASGLSIMLGMVMALMGGCWYPLELFPQAVQTAVHVLPTTWTMRGMLDILLRGQGLEGVLLEAAVLSGFAAIFFALGAWRFRYE
ncbi:MAG: ABC transporter permease [Candidatus Promineifilaceae bacterium]